MKSFTTNTDIGRVRIEETGTGNYIAKRGKKIVARAWVNPQNTYSAKSELPGGREEEDVCGLGLAIQISLRV